LEKGTNPSLFFETITSIQNQFLRPGAQLPKGEIIDIILDVASEVYRTILAVERRMKREELAVKDLERSVCEECTQLNQATNENWNTTVKNSHS
jgi:hypothetical protein